GFVAEFRVAVVHFRVNRSCTHFTIHGVVVNRLCSRCESVDGEVQFDDPKIVRPLPLRTTPLAWLITWCASRRTCTPALYSLSTLYESHSRPTLRYSVSSVMIRIGSPRLCCAMSASVCRSSVLRHISAWMPICALA